MTEYQADQCLELLSRKLTQKGNITSREIFQLLGYQIKKVAGCIGVNVFPAYQSKGMSSPAARHWANSSFFFQVDPESTNGS